MTPKHILLVLFLGFLGLAVLHTILREGEWVEKDNLPFSLVRRFNEATFEWFYFNLGWYGGLCYDWAVYAFDWIWENLFRMIRDTIGEVLNSFLPVVAFWKVFEGFKAYLSSIWDVSYPYLTSRTGVASLVAVLLAGLWYVVYQTSLFSCCRLGAELLAEEWAEPVRRDNVPRVRQSKRLQKSLEVQQHE